MPGRRGRKEGLPSSVANVVRGVRRAHTKLIPPIVTHGANEGCGYHTQWN